MQNDKHKSYYLIVISLRYADEEINGYILKDYLASKFNILGHLYDVRYNQIIINVPDHTKGEGFLGFSLKQLKDVAEEIADVDVDDVTVSIDFERQQLMGVFVSHVPAYFGVMGDIEIHDNEENNN